MVVCIYMSCMYHIYWAPHACLCLRRPKESIRSPATEVVDGGKMPWL